MKKYAIMGKKEYMNEPINESNQPTTASTPMAEKPMQPMPSDMRLPGLSASENKDEMRFDQPSPASGTSPFGWLTKMFRGE